MASLGRSTCWPFCSGVLAELEQVGWTVASVGGVHLLKHEDTAMEERQVGFPCILPSFNTRTLSLVDWDLIVPVGRSSG